MSDQPSNETQVSCSKYLSLSSLIALVIGFGVILLLAEIIAQETGGWLGWGIRLAALCIVFVLALIITFKYASPHIPILFGLVIAISARDLSNACARQIAGEGWGKTAVNSGIFFILYVIAAAIFTVIAKRHKLAAGG